MSWFKPVALCLFLAACGFQPVYGPGSTASALQNRVLVDEQKTRDGFLLVRQLEERIGPATDAAYALGLTIDVTQEGLAIDADGNILRYNVIGAAEYALRDNATGQILTSGKVDSFTGYSATGTFVATLAAEDDARERLMTMLADRIVIRLQTADL